VAWAELVSQAAAADVLIIGENHGHPVGLPWAAALWADVLGAEGAEGKGSAAALSLEFFERDEQSRLDDYLTGVSDEAAFLRRTERKPGNYPAGHRAMVERAKAMGRPVVAANATWGVVRFMRGKDYEALRTLTAEQQRHFRIPDAAPEGRYRADFDALMGPMIHNEAAPSPAGKKVGKAGPSEPPAMDEAEKQVRLDARFRTMQLWDWTMAESITRALESGHRPVVHIEGRFHSDFIGGTPQAVVKLRPGTNIVIISVVDAASDVLREEDRGRGDFIVYVGEEKQGK